MNAISTDAVLTSASTKVDGSLGLRFSTPELTPVEKTAIFELQGINLKILIQPTDGTACELKEVKGELNTKTPSQRLRAVLFLLWKQQNEAIDFEVFYRDKMNQAIEHVKRKLDNG